MGGIQTYSWLSTPHGHISDCKLDSVVYAGVCVVLRRSVLFLHYHTHYIELMFQEARRGSQKET